MLDFSTELQPSLVTVSTAAQHGADREFGWDTGWRKLPTVLLETPRRGTWRLDVDSQASRYFGDGEVLVVPAGLRHRLCSENNGAMSSSWIYLEWYLAGIPLRLEPKAGVFLDTSLANLVETLSGLVKRPASLVETIRFHRVGMEILETVVGRMHTESRSDPRIAKAMAFAYSRLMEPLTRADLAQVAGLSETRFHDVFSEVAGEAPMQYLNRLRLQKAVALLTHSGQSIGEIAEACGFTSSYYFSRFFKGKVGMPPSAFRKQTAQGGEREAG